MVPACSMQTNSLNGDILTSVTFFHEKCAKNLLPVVLYTLYTRALQSVSLTARASLCTKAGCEISGLLGLIGRVL
jgi:hypothetical protein